MGGGIRSRQDQAGLILDDSAIRADIVGTILGWLSFQKRALSTLFIDDDKARKHQWQ